MKITGIDVFRVAGELARPAWNSQEEWTSREGWLLRLRDETGIMGQGEASPLPGYSPDLPGKPEETLRALIPDSFPEFNLNDPVPEQVRSCLSLVDMNTPSAVFALETALFDIAGQRLGVPVSQLVNPDPQTEPIPLAALIDGRSAEESLTQASEAWDRGIRTMKLKIGRAGLFDDELALLQALRKKFGGELAIRADANGAWKLEEAGERLKALAAIEPEFVEQPVVPYLLMKLGESPVIVAADETVMIPAAVDRMSSVKACRILVLKPMALGGILRTHRLAKIAQARKYGMVISHLFDGPVALAASIALAHSLPVPPLACGLARHAGLSIWPEIEVPGLEDNRIVFTGKPGLGIPALDV